MGLDVFGFAYAATVAAGGIMGYVKAQSVPSLAAGLVFGGLLGYGAYQLSKNPNNIYIPLGASLFLTTLMSYRFFNSGKVMPAGLVAAISLANVLRLSYRIAMPVKEGKTSKQDEITLEHSTQKEVVHQNSIPTDTEENLLKE